MTPKPEKDAATNILIACLLGSALIAILGAMCVLCTSCTYSITMIHTEGTATDVVDEEQDASADVKPKLSIPVIP